MTYLQAAILGLVQGLTEFLPVSSSGHLALLEQWFEIDEEQVLLFAVLLHVGTLLSVLVVYWRDIRDLVLELVQTVRDLIGRQGLRLEERPVRKLGVLIIASTIPTGLIGVLFNDFFDSLYTSVTPIGIGLILTGVMLYFAERMRPGHRTLENMNIRNAVFIGAMQGVAICPGISRSGTTLFASLLCRLERSFAVKYVFLLSIPPILGSALLELPAALKAGTGDMTWGPILLGMLVAAVSGLIAIKTMIRVVSKEKLSVFSYYVWILGAVVVLYGVFGAR